MNEQQVDLTNAQPITKLAAIREFFQADGGRKIDMAELVAYKKDHPESLQELAQMCADALGRPLVANA